MNAQDIWSISKSIIASVGGAGIIICAVSSFVSARFAKQLDARYEQHLRKELARFESQLERHRHISKTQFDNEFDIYRKLSQAFFQMLAELSSYIDDKYRLESSPKEALTQKLEEFRSIIRVYADAQNLLYENAAFIPKDIFKMYNAVYEKANKLFWRLFDRLRSCALESCKVDNLIDSEDESALNEIDNLYEILNDRLREYLFSLSVAE